jgi:LuxR family maltose regulon positive regulatory protein
MTLSPSSPERILTSTPVPEISSRLNARLPAGRDRSLPRAAIVDRVVGAPEQIVALAAPAGYGKTTLLGQLADRMQPVGYVRLDGTDDDPAELLLDLLAALREPAGLTDDDVARIEPSGTVGDLTGLARLMEALTRSTRPVTLLLDDVQTVTSRLALDRLTWLVDRYPDPHRLVLAGRSATLPGGERARAQGRLLDLGATDLALTLAETRALAALEGVSLSADEATLLARRVEGWPAATYLALRARARHRSAPAVAATDDGGARWMDDFIRAELLLPLDPDTQSWLMRVALLDVLSCPLCDAALATTGSLQRLREIATSNQLVIALDDSRTRFRLHPLLAEVLRSELAARDPDAGPPIHRRAAEWLADQGDPLGAARHADASGDLGLLATLLARHAAELYRAGHIETMRDWLGRFDREAVRERHPEMAVLGAWLGILTGDVDVGTVWLEAAERAQVDRPMPDGSSYAAWLGVTRAMVGRWGIEAWCRDAETAMRIQAGPFVSSAPLMPLARELLVGSDPTRLDAELAVTVPWLRARGVGPSLIVALAIGAASLLERGDHARGRALVAEGLDLIRDAHLQDYVQSAALLAVAARSAAAGGRAREAREHMGAFNRLRPRLTAAIAWFAVWARIQGIRALLALHEPAAARVLLAEIREIQSMCAGLGDLDRLADEQRATVEAARGPGGGAWTLTAAELRLLAYLPTHLTFREIAERMALSPHTIKTQAMSIYGKLEASNRREALERAVEAGLLDSAILRLTGAPA